MPFRILVPRLYLLVAWMLVAAGAPTAIATTPAELPGASAAAFAHLETGEEEQLAAADIAMVAEFDPMQAVVELRETAGATLVTRLTPQLPPGVPPHGGRIVVLRAGERRLVQLGTVFNEEDLLGNDVLVEVLEGEGRLAVRLVGKRGEREEGDTPVSVSTAEDPAGSLATARRRPRRRLEVQKLTTTDLIDRAEASGQLGHETSVLYRVYAMFGDARLPAAYRGNDSAVFESLYLSTVRAEWSTYSPATQATLQPFLVPPAYSGSWAASARTLTPAGVTPMDSGPCSSLNPLWKFVDGIRGWVRVWYWLPSLDAARAGAFANEAETIIWPKLTDFMGAHAPLSDALFLCGGGNGLLDIYLTDVARSHTSPVALVGDACSNTPAYISLNRAETKETLAHEIFHAFQFSFPIAGSACITSPGYRWWTEGSAQWSMDKVYPPSHAEHPAASEVMDRPELSFDIPVDPHIYSTYLLPYYLFRKTKNAGFVRQAWENCAGMDAVGAVDLAIPEGWEGTWPELALHNWNSDPVDDYTKWDGLTDSPWKAALPTVVVLSGASDKEHEIPFDLPKLSTTYEHYLFSDDSVRSVAFWNGATFDLQKEASSPIAPTWDPKPATAAAREGLRVWALVKIKGQPKWQAPHDWTDEPSHAFCRDVAAERIEELVVIISNSQFLDPGKRAKPPGQAPRLSVSNMGCYKWKGTMSMTLPATSTLKADVTDVTWTREPAAPGDPTVSYLATGSLTSTLTGECHGTSGPVAIQSFLTRMFTDNYVPPDSAGRRAYWGYGITPTPFTAQCPGGPVLFPGSPTWFAAPAQPVFRLVGATGTRIKDTWTAGGATFTVDLTSQPEP